MGCCGSVSYTHLDVYKRQGLDSRMNLSFLYRNVESFNCYTFSHNWLNDDSEDIRIPKLICKQLKIKHILIPELNISQKELSTIKYLIGDYHSNLTIQLAYMYKSFFSNEAMINGDIAGQVGKSSLSRNTVSYTHLPQKLTIYRLIKISKNYLRRCSLYLLETQH